MIFLNVPQREDTDTDFSQNIPFLCDTIGLARMIDKPCKVSLVCGIDNLSFWCFHQIGTCRIAIFFNSGFSFFTICREYLSNILHDKISSVYFFPRKQSPSFSWSRLWIDTSILMFLEFSILAKISTITSIIITFCGHHSIETSLSTIVRYIVVLKICLFVRFWTAIAWLNLVAFWNFSFTL